MYFDVKQEAFVICMNMVLLSMSISFFPVLKTFLNAYFEYGPKPVFVLTDVGSYVMFLFSSQSLVVR